MSVSQRGGAPRSLVSNADWIVDGKDKKRRRMQPKKKMLLIAAAACVALVLVMTFLLPSRAQPHDAYAAQAPVPMPILSDAELLDPAAVALGWRQPSTAIPRVLHQSWSSRNVPNVLRMNNMRTWQEMQPEWGYELHTDADNTALVKERYPWLADAFANQMSHINRADVARLLYMHAFGGVYADLDFELVQPLEPLLEMITRRKEAGAILGSEPDAHAMLLERRPRQVCNAILASQPGHPFWVWVVRRMLKNIQSADMNDPVGSTGPRMLEVALAEWEAVHGNDTARAYVAPPQLFYPIWDVTQASTFKDRCQPTSSDWEHWDVYTPEIAEKIKVLCKQLEADAFEPRVPDDGTAFAAHHWAHTWLEGSEVSDGNVTVQDRPLQKPSQPPPKLDDAKHMALGRIDPDFVHRRFFNKEFKPDRIIQITKTKGVIASIKHHFNNWRRGSEVRVSMSGSQLNPPTSTRPL